MDLCACSHSCSIFSSLVIPEQFLHGKLGSCYEKRPVMSRIVATPIACVAGAVKPLLFPLICAVGVVTFPLIALIRACLGKKDGGEWLKAWVFSVIGSLGVALFVLAGGYYFSLVTSSAILISVLSFSITLHVYTYLKQPLK